MAPYTWQTLLAPERSGLIGQRLGSFVSPESLPVLKTFLQEAFLIHKAGPQKIECELILTDKSDSRRYAHIEGFSTEGNDQCRTVMVDITERKLAENGMKRENYRNKTLMHLASDGIHVMDIDGNILQANEAFCRMLGYSPEEMQTMNVAQWDAQWSNGELKEKFEQFIKEGRVWVFNTRHRCRDGRVIDVEISTVVVEIDGEPIIYASSRDITERRQIEDRLSENEERLRLALGAANQAWFDLEVQPGEVCVSSEYPGILGYDPDEFHSSLKEWQSNLHPEDRDVVLAAFRECLCNGGPTTMEYRRHAKDGSWVWLHSIGKIVEWGSQHQPLRMIGIHTDITARKQTEAKINKINRALNVISLCNRAIQRTLEENELLHEICRIIVENGGYRFAWVGYAEHDPETVRPVAHAWYEAGYLEAVNITWEDTETGRGPTGTAIRSGHPSIMKDAHTDPAFTPWRKDAIERGYLSTIALPLRVEEQTIGALNIYSAEPDAFDSDEIGLLTELTDDLAFGISSQRQRAIHKNAEELIWQQANFDLLTGLPNRRMFYDRLEQEIRKSSRAGLQLALMFLDLDRFKEINDTLGHDMGDLLLKEAARRLTSCVRASDTVARLGGANSP